MLESLLVYGSLALLMVLCGIIAARREPVYKGYSGEYTLNNKFIRPEIIFIIAAFTFVFGCRYGVGVDYFHYLFSYQKQSDREFEILFRVLSDFLSERNLHYAVYFSLWAFIQITLFYYAFRNQRFLYPLLAFFLIIGYGYMSWMNIIRQEIASGIFLVSLKYLDEKKLWKYMLCILIACCFHKASVILVVFYPLFLWRKDLFRKISWQMLFYVIALVISINYSEWFVEIVSRPYKLFTNYFKYQNYLYGFLDVERINSRAQFQTNTGYGIYITIIKTLPIILVSRQMKNFFNSSLFDMFYSLWFIRIITSFIVGSSIILNRPFAFFSNFNMIMSAYFVYYCFKSKKPIWQLFGVFYLLLYIAMFVYIVSNGDTNTSKFLFFWQI